jgi:hypothetical protein
MACVDLTDASALIRVKGKSEHWRELEKRLRRVMNLIFATAEAYQRWHGIDAEVGPTLHERLDRCELLLGTDDVRAVLVKEQDAVARFMANSRAVAEMFVKLTNDEPSSIGGFGLD